MNQLEQENKIVEKRSYNTVHGIWNYFTCSTQINLENTNYITANTLSAYDQFVKYYGEQAIIPILVQVEEGLRLQRALDREWQQQNPRYQELCRRFLADSEDFSIDNIQKRSITEFCTNSGSINNSIEQVNKILYRHL